MTIDDKYQKLRDDLSRYDSLAVAFSGGVDSSFLLKTAHEVLGDRALALTVDSVFIPRAEIEEALSFCRRYGIRQKIVFADVLADSNIKSNPPDRCYYCKRGLFELLRNEAEAASIHVLAEGTNTDDDGDYRPGMRALSELGIQSPLRLAGLSKAEIRELSRRAGLDSWDKPSMACLASRIAYGESLSQEKLSAVEETETLIRGFGVRQCRVRVHGTLARIEVPPEEFSLLLKQRDALVEKLRQHGYSYITLDLEGFRSGSMNEIL